MNILRTLCSITILVLVAVAITGCSDDDDTLAPFAINFASEDLGISPSSPEAQITLNFSRPSTVPGSILLSLEPGTLVYGETEDYYTSVAPVNNVITLPFESGDQSVGLTIFAGGAAALQEEKTLGITINEDTGTIFTPGSTNQLSVIFAENFIAESGSLQLDAGGPDFTSQAFVDLSKSTASSEVKNTWDLAFASAGFHVTLNATNQIMARSLDKTSLGDVTASDTTGFAGAMVVGPASSLEARAWIDDPTGDLENTAIAAISENDENNKIYIIKREGKNWKKVKINRSGDDYSIQFADISSATFEEITIEKDDEFNAVFFSLDNQIVSFEPQKSRWDLMYGAYTTYSTFGDPIPYSFSDYIVINKEKTSVAMVMIDDNTSYENFNLSSASSLSLSAELNTIGSTWRGVFPPSVLSDRFYVLKDSEGNYYKIRFTRLTGDNDERGRPSMTFELLK